MDFAHVVPLGRRCRTTHNLHQYFGIKESFPYDWYILPIKGVIRSLREGVDAGSIYDPAQMEPVRRDGKIIHVLNNAYGLWHVHCFPHEAGSEFVREDWADHLDKPLKRFEHTARRLKGLRDKVGPVLFVREGRKSDKAEDILALDDAIRAFIGTTPYRLLLINFDPSRVPEGYDNIVVDERPGLGWRGDGEAWSRALASTGYHVTQPWPAATPSKASDC
mgnify:CR=1 FL=1